MHILQCYPLYSYGVRLGFQIRIPLGGILRNCAELRGIVPPFYMTVGTDVRSEKNSLKLVVVSKFY